MTLGELVESLYALTGEIKRYEKKYGLASEDFYQLFRQGKLDDGKYEQTEEFCEWAGLYEIKRKRETQFRAWSQRTVFSLLTASENRPVQLFPLAEPVEV